MKKIFSLFSALLLTVSMWGAPYTITTVENFTAVPKGDKLLLTFNAEESSSNHYYYDICFEITPSADGFVGTFSKAAGTLSTTDTRLNWIYNQSAANPGKLRTGRTLYSGSSQTITIAKVSEDSYTMSGTLNARTANETSDKVYNFSNIPFSVYGSEPAQEASAIDLTGKTMSITSYEDIPMVFTIENGFYCTLYLQLNVAEYAQPAAGTTFSVAASGNNTIQSSFGQTFVTGASFVTPLMSYYEDYSGWDPYYYFIIDGSLTVSYSQDNKTMTLAGTLTTAHGTEIIVNNTMNNPWFVPEPETVELTVTSVSVTGTTNLSIGLTAAPNNFMIGIYGNTLDGATIDNIYAYNTYADFGGYEYSDMDDTKTDVNALSIVATGNPNEYELNATIVCQNKNTYVMEDVIFTYSAPTPWDAEPEYVEGGIEFTATSLTKTFSNQKQRFSFQDNDYNRVVLEFKTPTDVAPTAGNHTIVNPDVASPANGDVLGSQGYISYTQYPSYYYNYDEYAYYYFRSGTVNVAYSDDNRTITMTGTLTTAHGTEITVSCEGDNPWGPKEVDVNVDYVAASVTVTGLNFDIVGDANVPEILLAVNGTQANPLALAGTYGYDKFDDWNLIYTKTSYTYMTTGSEVTISNEEGQMMLNATLIGENGYTYYVKDAEITYSVAVSDQVDPTTTLTRAEGATVNMTVQRTLIQDNCVNSICLPFSIANIEETPLAGATVYSMTDAIMDGEVISFIFETVNAIEAGKPYLIKWPAGTSIVNPVFNNVTIEATEGATVEGTNAKFIGILEPTVMDANSLFVGANNTVSYSSDEDNEASLKGFRAYFQLSTLATAPKKACLVLGGNSAPTSILTPKAMKYNKVIENGQFVIIRNNVRINALGQTIR